MIFEELKRARRSLFRRPGLLVVTTVCLAVGIGTQTVVFELLDALLFREPPGTTASRAHRLFLASQDDGVVATNSTLPYPAVTALREADVFDDLASYFRTEIPVPAARSKLPTAFVDASYFDILGVTPRYGRLFTVGEATLGRPSHVVLLSHATAERLFGAARNAVGLPLRLDDHVVEVVGVLAEDFAGIDFHRIDLFLPMSTADQFTLTPGWHTQTNAWFLNALVRDPRPLDASRPSAAQVLSQVLGKPYEIRYGALQPARHPENPLGTSLLVGIAFVASVILVLACMVVTSLFLIRHIRRRDELGIRRALGASDGDLLQLLLAEALIVALLAGVLALVLASAEARLIRALVLPETAPALEIAYGRVFVFVTTLVGLVALVCGLLPAIRLRGYDAKALLSQGGPNVRVGRAEEVLACFQVALGTISIVAVGWFLMSSIEAGRFDLGFDPHEVVVSTVATSDESPQQVDLLLEDVKSRLETLPQIESVSRAAGVPLSSSFGVSVSLPGGRSVPQLETGGPYLNGVTPEFFDTLGTRILHGRGFLPSDEQAGSEPVTVVNQTFARRVFPGQQVLGSCLVLGDRPCVRIVGLVQDARRSGLKEGPTFQLYVPSSQMPDWMGSAKHLFIRTPRDASYDRLIHQAVQSVVGDRLVETRRLASYLERDLRPLRITTTMLTVFAVLAVGLVVLGIYALLGRFVLDRVPEIGLRLALGARRSSIAVLIARRSLRFFVPGLLLGLAIALLLGRFVEPFLFQVSSSDLRVWVSASTLLVLLAVVAGIRPTRRAFMISPADALSAD